MSLNIPTSELVELESPRNFDQTVSRILAAIREAGLLMITQLDHFEGAKAVGLQMPRTLVIVYGHPKGGTPIMLAFPAAALDLPLKVLVRETSAKTAVVAFHPIVELLERLGVPAELSAPLKRSQLLIREALSP